MTLRKRKKTTDAEKVSVRKAARPAKVRARLHRWRWPVVVVLGISISGAVLLAWWISLFNAIGADDAVQRLLVFYVGTKVEKQFDPRLTLILVSKNNQPDGPSGKADPAHRKFHGELLRALSAAGARLVVFDMEFAKEAQDKTVDQEFAAAIDQVTASGTEVLVGADLDGVDPSLAPLLEPSLKNRWGSWDGGKSDGTSDVRFVRLGIEKPGQEREPGERTIMPSLALRVVQHARYPGQNIQTFYNPLSSQVVLREGGAGGPIVNRFPVDKWLYFIVDMVGEDEMGRRPSFNDVYSQRANQNYMRQFKDKIVVVGYEAEDVKSVSESEKDKRYGADIQANAMSNLLMDSYIYPLSFPYHYVIILAMIAIGIVLRIRFCQLMNYRLPIKIPGFIEWKPQVPVVLIILSVLYIFIAMLVYRLERARFSIPYHILALFLAYLLTSGICRRLGFK